LIFGLLAWSSNLLLCGTSDKVPLTKYEFATLTTTKSITMDKYDYMILDIIQTYKQEQQAHIRLAVLERNFWKRIEADTDLSVGQARIGERITNLYLDGMLQNKNGYTLTKKGREQLALAPWKQNELV